MMKHGCTESSYYIRYFKLWGDSYLESGRMELAKVTSKGQITIPTDICIVFSGRENEPHV